MNVGSRYLEVQHTRCPPSAFRCTSAARRAARETLQLLQDVNRLTEDLIVPSVPERFPRKLYNVVGTIPVPSRSFPPQVRKLTTGRRKTNP